MERIMLLGSCGAPIYPCGSRKELERGILVSHSPKSMTDLAHCPRHTHPANMPVPSSLPGEQGKGQYTQPGFRFLGNTAAWEGQRPVAPPYTACRGSDPLLPPHWPIHSHLPLCCAQQSLMFDTRQIDFIRKLVPEQTGTVFLESVLAVSIPKLAFSLT